MDNAKYHKVKTFGAPKVHKLTRKTQVLEWLQHYGVAHDPTATVSDLKEQLRTYINNFIPMEVERLANELGYQVLFTPAYHSDLQPIELVWAVIKGSIGRQYKKGNNTLADTEK